MQDYTTNTQLRINRQEIKRERGAHRERERTETERQRQRARQRERERQRERATEIERWGGSQTESHRERASSDLHRAVGELKAFMTICPPPR